ncbi:hypothetical protein MMC28_006792 [Mycoblastus sanguinarius]|nr:hypothetical protein [Mycoblastus sanguinarius]
MDGNGPPSMNIDELTEKVQAFKAIGEECVTEIPQEFTERMARLDSQMSYLSYNDTWERNDHLANVHIKDAPWSTQCDISARSVGLEYIYGDRESAAIYRIADETPQNSIDKNIPIDELKRMVDKDAINMDQFVKGLASIGETNEGKSLKALASTVDLYKLLPEATIALNVASKPLHTSLWATNQKVEIKLFESAFEHDILGTKGMPEPDRK